MDILAHALWASVGISLAHRRWPINPTVAAITVALSVLPDVPHLLPIFAWSALGDGTFSALSDYSIAVPGQEPTMPSVVTFLSHHLHCMTHSAIVAGAITAWVWAMRRTFWVPLLGWWSHILIDVFTHSIDYYPSPVFYPITQRGFDGVAWNRPWFMVLNYAALVCAGIFLMIKDKTK